MMTKLGFSDKVYSTSLLLVYPMVPRLLTLFLCFISSSVFAATPLPAAFATMPSNMVYSNIAVTSSGPAMVHVFKGKDLIYLGPLKSGQNVLNPIYFPMGSYPIKIEVIQNGKIVAVTNDYFVKIIPDPSQIVTSLTVDLLKPAKVTVSRDAAILFSYDYQASGFYQIDTSKFPVGTYPLKMNIVGHDPSYHDVNIVIFSQTSNAP